MIKKNKLLIFITLTGLCLIALLFRDTLTQSMGFINGTIAEIYSLEKYSIKEITIYSFIEDDLIIDKYKNDDDDFQDIKNYLSNISIKSLPNNYQVDYDQELECYIYLKFEEISEPLKISVFNNKIISVDHKKFKIQDEYGFKLDAIYVGNNAV